MNQDVAFLFRHILKMSYKVISASFVMQPLRLALYLFIKLKNVCGTDLHNADNSFFSLLQEMCFALSFSALNSFREFENNSVLE